MSHTMRVLEKVTDKRLKEETTMSKNQFEFKPVYATMESIFCVRLLTERGKHIWQRFLKI